ALVRANSTGGTYAAQAAVGGRTAAFALTNNQPPALTSAAATTFTVGTFGTFATTTTGFPTPALTLSGALPAGVAFTDKGNGTATPAGPPARGPRRHLQAEVDRRQRRQPGRRSGLHPHGAGPADGPAGRARPGRPAAAVAVDLHRRPLQRPGGRAARRLPAAAGRRRPRPPAAAAGPPPPPGRGGGGPPPQPTPTPPPRRPPPPADRPAPPGAPPPPP